MPGTDPSPEDFVETTLAAGSCESLTGLLVVLAARRGHTPEEIAAFLSLPIEEVNQWLGNVEADSTDVGPPSGEFDVLEDAIRTIVGAETPDGVVESVAAVTDHLFETRNVVVYRYDGVRDELVPAASTDTVGFDPERITSESETVWSAFQSGDATFDSTDVLVVPAGTFGAVRIGDVAEENVTDVELRAVQPVASAAAGSIVRLRRIESLQADRDELRQENEQLRDFASIVSHDLRNPLSVAVGSFEMVVETGDEEYIEQVKEAHDRIEGIIEHTLSLAHEGRQVDEAEPIELESIARRAWQAAETRQGSLEVRDTTTFDADPDRLQQALENLFRNAVEHGSEDVDVRVGTLEDGFYVADDGPGVPAEERERIFEREYSTSEHGSGLGLHIVHEIVEGHGWTITVSESDAGGARFEIEGV